MTPPPDRDAAPTPGRRRGASSPGGSAHPPGAGGDPVPRSPAGGVAGAEGAAGPRRSAGRPRAARIAAVAACVLVLAAGALLLVRGLQPAPAPDAPLPSAPFTVAAPAPVAHAAPTPRRGPPSRLRIASLGVDAPLEDVALDPGGALVIPGDPARVGRWTGGAGPRDAAGTMLLAGHVDEDGRLGALHDLARITPGALVETSDAAGTITAWRVVSLAAVRKDAVPRFDRAGPHRLVLVTCGGRVLHTDAGASYEDNVVVTAVPAI